MSNIDKLDVKASIYRNGSRIIELVRLVQISWGEIYLEAKPAVFTYQASRLTVFEKEAFVTGNELRIFLKAVGETEYKLRWAGEITVIETVIDNQGRRTSANEGGQKTFTVTAIPWIKRILGNRSVTRVFTAKEESEIAYDIVTDAQTVVPSGFTAAQVWANIVRGNIEITDNIRDRTYVSGNVLEKLQELAQVMDADVDNQRVRGFRLTPDMLSDKYLSFDYEADFGQDRSDIILENTQITRIRRIEDITQYSNRIVAISNQISGYGVSTRTDDTNYYKMREKYVNAANIENLEALNDKAQQIVNDSDRKNVIYDFSLVTNNRFTGYYRVGDLLRLRFQGDVIDIDATVRVYEINLTWNDKAQLSTELKVAEIKPLTLNLLGEDRFIAQVIQLSKDNINIVK